MRRIAICVLIAGLCGSALAAESGVQDRVAAARDSAVAGLMEQIGPTPLAGNLTVKDFLDQTGGADELVAALAAVEPMGGPRWLDEQTCQVRLEVPGTMLVSMLGRIAAAHPQQTPIPAAALPGAAATVGLGWHWFTATGTSTSLDDAPPPPPDSPWSAVPPEERRRMVQLAGSNAAQNVLASISPMIGGDQMTPMAKQSIKDWLASRPVTAVEYMSDDRGVSSVRVTLAVDAGGLCNVLRAAAATQPDAGTWESLRMRLARQIGPAVGLVRLPAGAAAVSPALPAQPPDWVANMADASGVGGPAANSLRASRAAQADAVSHLQRQVMALHLTGDQTIGQAAAGDPRLGRLVEQTIARDSQLYKSDYRPDGTVEVRMSLDLRLLWAAISGNP
jgi:hypothetical protein